MRGMKRDCVLDRPVMGGRGSDIILQERGQQFMGSANDMKAAEKTYSGFITMIKWSAPIIALIVLFVVVLIA